MLLPFVHFNDNRKIPEALTKFAWPVMRLRLKMFIVLWQQWKEWGSAAQVMRPDCRKWNRNTNWQSRRKSFGNLNNQQLFQNSGEHPVFLKGGEKQTNKQMFQGDMDCV